MGTILENKEFKKSKLSKTLFNKSWSPSSIFLTEKNDFESTNFEMFKEVVHNFGKSDNDMI